MHFQGRNPLLCNWSNCENSSQLAHARLKLWAQYAHNVDKGLLGFTLNFYMERLGEIHSFNTDVAYNKKIMQRRMLEMIWCPVGLAFVAVVFLSLIVSTRFWDSLVVFLFVIFEICISLIYVSDCLAFSIWQQYQRSRGRIKKRREDLQVI